MDANEKLHKEMVIQELTKALSLIIELWFVIGESKMMNELCEKIETSIENCLSFMNSMDPAAKSTGYSTGAESASSVSQMKQAKRRRDEDPSSRDQEKSKEQINTRKRITDSPFMDGYQWRKYGQKTILNSKYQRCYYRCTYSGCKAKRQVQQKNSSNPPTYEVTSINEHTCNATTTGPEKEPHLMIFESKTKEEFSNSNSYGNLVPVPQLSIDKDLSLIPPLSPAGQFYGLNALMGFNALEEPFDPFSPYY